MSEAPIRPTPIIALGTDWTVLTLETTVEVHCNGAASHCGRKGCQDRTSGYSRFKTYWREDWT